MSSGRIGRRALRAPSLLRDEWVSPRCIERCAFGAIKSWTGFMIASNEIPINRRVDFDTTVDAMALTAKEMNGKYKETSEGDLAVSVVLC
jgi:L-serine dehydratase